MENKLLRVAIDGPGGAGKSTVAKILAKNYSLEYVDTGAMYRAMGYKFVQEGIDDTDPAAVAAVLESTDIDFAEGKILLDGNDVSGFIRTPEISMMASKVSAIPAVREKLVAIQKSIGLGKNVIMDGRDIGTNVMPDAEFKFYITATPEERARRRFLELEQKGQNPVFEDVLADINKRDYDDSHREMNPLRQAEDALLVDTTEMNLEEVVAFVSAYIDENR